MIEISEKNALVRDLVCGDILASWSERPGPPSGRHVVVLSIARAPDGRYDIEVATYPPTLAKRKATLHLRPDLAVLRVAHGHWGLPT